MSETPISAKAIAGYHNLSEVKAIEIAPGIRLQLVSGEKTMMSFVTLEPGATVPLHSHPHEQLGTVLQGETIMYIGGSDEKHGRLLKAGDTYIVPGGMLHGARNPGSTPSLVLDVFGPVREDYIAMFRAEHGHDVAGLHQEQE